MFTCRTLSLSHIFTQSFKVHVRLCIFWSELNYSSFSFGFVRDFVCVCVLFSLSHIPLLLSELMSFSCFNENHCFFRISWNTQVVALLISFYYLRRSLDAPFFTVMSLTFYSSKLNLYTSRACTHHFTVSSYKPRTSRLRFEQSHQPIITRL